MPRLSRAVAALCAATALLVTTGCSEVRPTATSDPSGGYGAARFALYATSNFDDSDLHGRVILVHPDGTFAAIPTQGMYIGKTAYVDGWLYLSDTDDEIRIGRDQIQRRPRHDDNPMLDSVLPWGDTALTVFNSGMGDRTYLSDLSTWTDDGLATGRLRGEPWAVTVCGARAYALMGEWEHPTSQVRILRLDVHGEEIRTTRVGTLHTRGGPREIDSFGCTSGGRLLATLSEGNRLYVAAFEPDGQDAGWLLVTRDGRPIAGPASGLVTRPDGTLYFVTPRGSVMWIDPDTARATSLTRLERGDYYQYSLAGRELLVHIQGAAGEDDPVLVRVDLDTGRRVARVVVDGLNAYLDGKEEVLGPKPTLIG